MIGVLLLLLRPDAAGAEVLLTAALLAVAVLAAASLVVLVAPRPAVALPGGARFAEVRVLLRVSDPAAAGHRRARAPGRAR